MTLAASARKVDFLPAGGSGLAHGIPPAAPGTLFVQGPEGGMRVAPDAGFTVVFGRCKPDVHVCVGAADQHVSRRHGYIRHDGARWVLSNSGRLPIRFPDRLLLGGQDAELPAEYTPLFILGPDERHLLETRIAARPRSGLADPPGTGAAELCEAGTADRDVVTPDDREALLDGRGLESEVEHLVLVALARRYLAQAPNPTPLTWVQVAEEMARVQPDAGWNWRRVARVVEKVRKRLSPRIPGLLEEEIPPPIGNALNHNLIDALLVRTTLVQSDLLLLEAPERPN
ncbi:hypothetical protein [Actinomadura sp. WMMB 499]|uniref:hypothetical protein n=1 Tax=Actinomadura sp. WMMB 499 TaxID=1219491 RepID=UPI001243FAD3|nr:hypothetical protein [Actinomadura sp. WMMB 499]QFG21980.1 hypothetical protein F7P10_13485 [Actinomadura sp. WMMB 499]